MKTKQKVVHLHLKIPIGNGSDFFFGSIKAMYEHLPDIDLGIKYKSLTNALRGQDFYENRRCTVRVGVLITKSQKKTEYV